MNLLDSEKVIQTTFEQQFFTIHAEIVRDDCVVKMTHRGSSLITRGMKNCCEVLAGTSSVLLSLTQPFKVNTRGAIVLCECGRSAGKLEVANLCL